MKLIDEGLLSPDRPEVEGSPRHREIMTKVGHALPNVARKIFTRAILKGKELGSETPEDKARYANAGKQVMRRKAPVPKLEEGSLKNFIKGFALGPTPQSDRAGNDPNEYINPPVKRKPMKKTIKENKAGDILKRVGDKLAADTRKYKAKQDKKPKPVDDSMMKDARQDDSKVSRSVRRLREEQLQELTGKGKLSGLFKAGARAKLKGRIDKKQANFEKSAHENATKKKLNIDGVKKVYANLKTAERMQKMKDRITEEQIDESWSGRKPGRNETDRSTKAQAIKSAGKGINSPMRDALNPKSKEERYAETLKHYIEFKKKNGLKEGRTAGENIDAHIARNGERADHHTNEYLGNPRGIQSREHASKADRHTAVYQRLKQYKKTGKIHESIAKKISRAFNKVTGIQRAGLAYKTEKDYKEAARKSDGYHEIARDYEDDYKKSKRKSDKNSMEYYKGKRDDRDKRIKDLDKRSRRIDNAGKRLEEAISRRLIAKKNAEKQRSKYVRRKGEVPPIMTPKNRHKFTDKEVNKLKGVLGKQKAQRGEVRDFALMRKKGIIKATPVAPPAPEEDAMKSTTVYAAPPTPGVIQRVPGPKPLHAEDAFKQGLDHFTRTGDSNSLDVAKRAAASMYSQELISLGKLSFRDGKDKHNSYKMAKDRYNNNINSVDAMYRINNSIENPPKPKKGFMDKIKGLIRK